MTRDVSVNDSECAALRVADHSPGTPGELAVTPRLPLASYWGGFSRIWVDRGERPNITHRDLKCQSGVRCENYEALDLPIDYTRSMANSNNNGGGGWVCTGV